MGRLRRIIPVVCALALLAPGAAAASERSAGLETVLQDDAQFLHRPTDQVRGSLKRLRTIGVDRLRVTANWSVLTRDAGSETRPEFDATDPAAYEQGRWAALDQVVRLANEEGLEVMIDIAFFAPRWASSDPAGERGRTELDTEQFARFSAAVAKRYSGAFTVPVDAAPVAPNEDEQLLDSFLGGDEEEAVPPPSPPGAPPLPRVDIFTLWNEPNHTGFMRPQWIKRRGEFHPRSPEIYRAMVMRAYPLVKAAAPQSKVLVGATSGAGAYRNKGTGGVPPLRFLRELACVDGALQALNTPGCRDFKPIPGDGWSHHPYSMKAEPDVRSGPNQLDDVPMAELPRLVRALDQLAAAGRISPALRDVWITEYGYETNPPSTISKFGADDQARFLPWGEYLAWRIPEVKSFAQFLLRDLPPGSERVGASLRRPFGEWFSGLEFPDGRAKPAMRTFRAGLFVQRIAGGKLRLFARLRLGAGARKVAFETRRRAGAPWVPVLTTPGAARTGGARELVVDGRSVVSRRARASAAGSARYRLRYTDAAGFGYSPSVRAARPAAPPKPLRR